MDPNFWYFITLFGEGEIWLLVFIAIGVIYGFLRYKTSYARPKTKSFKNFLFIAIISLLIGYVIVTGLKMGLAIPRPCIPCIDGPDCNMHCPEGFSFPSGHSTVIFTVVTSLLLTIKKKWVLPLYIVAVLVAVSRVALGVHYAGDVIAGSSLGIGLSLVVWRALKTQLKM